MEYYGYRFMGMSQQLFRNLLRGNDMFHIDREEFETNDAVEWAKSLEKDLKELGKLRKGVPVRSRERIGNYREAVLLAFTFAWNNRFDIVFTDHADEFSMIVLHRDAMLFDRKSKSTEMRLLHQLEDAADEVYFASSTTESGDLRLNMQFIFDLCDTSNTE